MVRLRAQQTKMGKKFMKLLFFAESPPKLPLPGDAPVA
jgi:hypothetical protein